MIKNNELPTGNIVMPVEDLKVTERAKDTRDIPNSATEKEAFEMARSSKRSRKGYKLVSQRNLPFTILWLCCWKLNSKGQLWPDCSVSQIQKSFCSQSNCLNAHRAF